MTATTLGAASDFRVGGVIGRSIDLLRTHFLKFMALSFAMWLPNLLALLGALKPNHPLTPSLPAAPGSAPSPGLIGGIALFTLAWLFLFALCQPAIIYGAFQGMRGRGIAIGEAFSRALRRLFPVLGVMIVGGVTVMVGVLLLVVPGFIFLTMFYVAIPVCVVERLGPIRSLGRSSDLTKGYRWRIFGLVILVALINGVVLGLQKVLNMAVGGIPATAGDALLQVVFFAFELIVYAVAYHDLRVVKEGVDIEQLASVFD